MWFFGVGFILCLTLGITLEMTRIVPTQEVAITRNIFTQKLSRPKPAGIISKPYLGSVHTFPGSTNFQRCESYSPAIKGGYEVKLDVCFYLDTATLDWLKEIQRTGQLDDGKIMSVWRNEIVGRVAEAVRERTPDDLTRNRAQAEADIEAGVSPWYTERGITLNSISLTYWDFTSELVKKEYDASIAAQRAIAEQQALFDAAKISRERQEYEADTVKLVADKYAESLGSLGIRSEQATIQWLTLQWLGDSGKQVNALILDASGRGGSIPLALPLDTTQPVTGTVQR